MKKTIASFLMLLLQAATLNALTIGSKHPNLVKFEIQLHSNAGSTNYIYKWLNLNQEIDMPGLFSARDYLGPTFSIIVYDLDYSQTRVVCVDHMQRNDRLKVTYLGRGKCRVD